MLKLLKIEDTVTACRGCVYATYDNAFDGWNCVKVANYPRIPAPDIIPAWCPLLEAPAPVEKRCGTCIWWKRFDPLWVFCRPPVAISIEHYEARSMHEKTKADDCPTWAAKEGLCNAP